MTDTKIEISDRKIWLAGAAFLFFMAMSFSAGMVYGERQARFTYHEIPLKSKGVALLIPDGWQVVQEWDKYGRPYTIPTDEESP
jgi:hypothetical protein